MRVISKTGASGVEHPPNSGNFYEPGSDGVFEMPEHVARDLSKKHASQWVLESAHAGTQRRDRAAKLRNPRAAADALTTVLDRVAALEQRVADLEELVEDEPEQTHEADGAPESSGESEGASADGEETSDPEPTSKPASPRSRSTKSGSRAKASPAE